MDQWDTIPGLTPAVREDLRAMERTLPHRVTSTTPSAYQVDGRWYDRVTAICALWPNPQLAEWREEVGKARANRDLRHAEHIGKTVDVIITAWLQHGRLTHPPNLSVEVRQALQGFREWWGLNPIQPLHLQTTLLAHVKQVGGTVDCLTATEGFDWKTSSRLSFPHLLQINAYWELAELNGSMLTAYRLVRFDKILGTWEEAILTPLGIDWHGQHFTRAFLSECFETLLKLARQVREVSGVDPTPTTATLRGEAEGGEA